MQNVESAEVVGAFVTFQNVKSFARCSADYSGSGSRTWSHFQPTPMRFRGTHKLKVSAAPEPS